MARLTINDLNRIKEEYRTEFALRAGEHRVKVTVHLGDCGIKAGARDMMKVLIGEIEKRDVNDVIVVRAGCAGLCEKEPMIAVETGGEAPVIYGGLDGEKIKEIFEEHVQGGRPVRKHVVTVPKAEEQK